MGAILVQEFDGEMYPVADVTWNLKKVSEVANEPSFYPRGLKIELIFALHAAVLEIVQFYILIIVIN